MKNFTFVSSNINKLKEYQEIMPELKQKKGVDLKEIKADAITVALYKAVAVNEDLAIIEDTVLEIYENENWKEIVDIRWKIKELNVNVPARWIVHLAYTENNLIKVFKGVITGTLIVEKFIENSFGFDSIFIPAGTNKTLLELNTEKSYFSARRLAMDALKEDNTLIVMKKEDLPIWDGEYQND